MAGSHPTREASEDGRASDVPYAPPRRRTRGDALDARLRNTLPRPTYELLLDGYHVLRKLARRNPGRGRVLPDFVIIGAAKAGTTSVFGWLVEHPHVEGPWRKEINYFSYFHYRGEDWYRQHFPPERRRASFAAEHGRPFLTGEASPSYLLHYWAPQRMARLLPDVKLIVQLRNPVDRAYSQFQMRRRDGEEPLESFAEAVEIEDQRLEHERARMLADPRYSSQAVACWSYLMRSRYAEQLERWFAHFPRRQFHFLTLEELAADPQRTLDGVHDFLELPPRRPDQLQARFAFDYAALPGETRRRLEDYFRPHNERLYELVGIDFGWEGGRATPAAGVSPRERVVE
jgi:Sulfotransferase domain